MAQSEAKQSQLSLDDFYRVLKSETQDGGKAQIKEVAEKMGKSRSHTSRRLKTLEAERDDVHRKDRLPEMDFENFVYWVGDEQQ